MEITVSPGNSVVVTASFYDEEGAAVVPTTADWTLTDGDGNVVNGRSEVPLTPAEVVSFSLGGDDFTPGSGSNRTVTVKCTYPSVLIPGETLESEETATIYVDTILGL